MNKKVIILKEIKNTIKPIHVKGAIKSTPDQFSYTTQYKKI